MYVCMCDKCDGFRKDIRTIQTEAEFLKAANRLPLNVTAFGGPVPDDVTNLLMNYDAQRYAVNAQLSIEEVVRRFDRWAAGGVEAVCPYSCSNYGDATPERALTFEADRDAWQFIENGVTWEEVRDVIVTRLKMLESI